jgi:hypothetical protein
VDSATSRSSFTYFSFRRMVARGAGYV